ncbi:divalent-cation tolerance protein CutA [Vibrio sp. SCSIO 43136]|uniref:divalent-cation tolerance protein CutA n=1 Tax=Vibrio sp. SCSIO 43136 TaxID=2819101 RepID=UPI0020763A3B|nr:divalent-cation tolerance protein CutA [Vibrio sp. SCSIO 43136]USD68204.1 divalent-cation tolerance protein CutA [Vibrio sp. SCSIO 43136]
MSETSFCTVLSTYCDDEVGKTIIDSLLNKKLAACIQVMPIQSHYLWQGEICQDSEKLMIIKTTHVLYESVEAEIVALHDYETPQVVQLPITNGLEAYLQWLSDSTSR